MLNNAQDFIIQEKQHLREEMKKLRSALDAHAYLQQNEIVNHTLLQTPWLTSKNVFAGYIAIHHEVDISPFLQKMFEKGKTILLPRIHEDTLQLFKVEDFSKIHVDRFGSFQASTTAQPFDIQKVEVCFVPGLAYDTKGNRIGYGKGYYDRFLSHLFPQTITVGIAHPFQIKENIPTEKSDVPVKKVIF